MPLSHESLSSGHRLDMTNIYSEFGYMGSYCSPEPMGGMFGLIESGLGFGEFEEHKQHKCFQRCRRNCLHIKGLHKYLSVDMEV